jgi:ATP-dependent DNA helicase 2 subunit 2
MIQVTTSGKTGNRLKFDRRINIVTDGQGLMDISDLDAIAAKLKEDEIEVTLLYVCERLTNLFVQRSDNF